MLCRTLGGEGKHSHPRLCKSSHTLCSLSRTYGNLSQLGSIRHWGHSDVTHNQNTLFAILRSLGNQQHSSTDTGDSRSTFDNLECRAKSVSGGGKRSADLSVGIPALDDETSVIERIVVNKFLRSLESKPLLLPELIEQLHIFLSLVVGGRVDYSRLPNVLKSE